MNPQEVAKMIEEENKDLEEVLRILPPELEPEPEVYPLRKNIQKLQLSSVPVEMLEKVLTCIQSCLLLDKKKLLLILVC